MSDLTERLRNDAAYDRWNLGEGEVSNAAEAADRIEELEAALLAAQKVNGRLVVEKLNLKRQLKLLKANNDPGH